MQKAHLFIPKIPEKSKNRKIEKTKKQRKSMRKERETNKNREKHDNVENERLFVQGTQKIKSSHTVSSSQPCIGHESSGFQWQVDESNTDTQSPKHVLVLPASSHLADDVCTCREKKRKLRNKKKVQEKRVGHDEGDGGGPIVTLMGE